MREPGPYYRNQTPPGPAYGYVQPRPPVAAPRVGGEARQPGSRVSVGEAAERAQQMNGGGRVLAVHPDENGYRVRVIKNGEVRSVYVPGNN
jgi:hypothetical protein